MKTSKVSLFLAGIAIIAVIAVVGIMALTSNNSKDMTVSSSTNSTPTVEFAAPTNTVAATTPATATSKSTTEIPAATATSVIAPTLPETTNAIATTLSLPTLQPTIAPITALITISGTQAVMVSIPTSTPLPANLTDGIPNVVQKPYSLLPGEGVGPGAQSCANPLPLEAIRTDYLAYWNAEKEAQAKTDISILAPYIDQQTDGGAAFWSQNQKYYDKVAKGNYYTEYQQVLHSNPIQIEIEHTSIDHCRVYVLDSPRVTEVAKFKATN